MGSVLARATNGQNVAIIQLGSTLPSTSPPTRIAEEYAMLDCISGGRLVAGFPDRPADRRHDLQRRRAGRAARALSRGAGAGASRRGRRRRSSPGTASTTSSHGQPVAAADPAAASADLDSGLRQLHDRGVRRRPRRLLLPSELLRRQECRSSLGDCYWETGREARAATQSVPLRLPAADRRCRRPTRRREEYAPHAEYFFHKLLYTPSYYQAIPGCQDYRQHAARDRNAAAGALRPARAQVQGLHRARLSSSSAARRPCAISCSMG